MASPDRTAYVVERAERFVAWLRTMEPNEELLKIQGEYTPEAVVPTVLTLLVPLAKSGRIALAVEAIAARLGAIPAGQEAAVRSRVRAYLECFIEALTAA